MTRRSEIVSGRMEYFRAQRSGTRRAACSVADSSTASGMRSLSLRATTSGVWASYVVATRGCYRDSFTPPTPNSFTVGRFIATSNALQNAPEVAADVDVEHPPALS